MDQMRKIYQRAVCLPLENLEALWQQYNAFENDLNKTTVVVLFSLSNVKARKFVAEKSPAYMQARSALRQMRSIMGGLDRNKIPRPSTWTPPERQEVYISHSTLIPSSICGRLGLNGKRQIP
jgi:cleavage stimulation factor subunit 3